MFLFVSPPNATFGLSRLGLSRYFGIALPCLVGFFILLARSADAQVQWNLIWNDESSGATNNPPDSGKWAYDTPSSGAGNNELETYCGQSGTVQSGVCSNWLQHAYLDGQGN